jgi:hypothetical protein
MARKTARSDSHREPSFVAPLAWCPAESSRPSAPPGQRARWLLAAAIVLQGIWIVALAAMAIFVRWRT